MLSVSDADGHGQGHRLGRTRPEAVGSGRGLDGTLGSVRCCRLAVTGNHRGQHPARGDPTNSSHALWCCRLGRPRVKVATENAGPRQAADQQTSCTSTGCSSFGCWCVFVGRSDARRAVVRTPGAPMLAPTARSSVDDYVQGSCAAAAGVLRSAVKHPARPPARLGSLVRGVRAGSAGRPAASGTVHLHGQPGCRQVRRAHGVLWSTSRRPGDSGGRSKAG
jgi:hypothetical protein